MANPKAAAALVTAGFLTLAAFAVTKKKKRKVAPGAVDPATCNPAPYTFNDSAIAASIEASIAAGTKPDMVAVEVATEHFSQHPSGATVVFPPTVNLPGVACVWAKVLWMVDERLSEPGTNEPVVFETHGALDPGYPWEAPTIHLGGDGISYPTPSTFYIMDAPNVGRTTDGKLKIDSSGKMLQAILGSAIAMANQLPGNGPMLDPAKAASTDPVYVALRMQILAYLTCNWLNGRTYAQTDPAKAGGQLGMVNGKGLNYTPVHADNIGRLQAGLPLLRTTNAAGSRIVPAAQANRQMQQWIPGFNLQFLRSPSPIITTQGMQWSNGMNCAFPPPAVFAKGVQNGIPHTCPDVPS